MLRKLTPLLKQASVFNQDCFKSNGTISVPPKKLFAIGLNEPLIAADVLLLREFRKGLTFCPQGTLGVSGDICVCHNWGRSRH